MMSILPELIEVDLALTTRKGSAELRTGPVYLCLIGGQFFCGRFSEAWYGLNFEGWHYGLQYDPPGENYSDWQKVWRIGNADEIAQIEELPYAISRRQYAISNRLRSNHQCITTGTSWTASGSWPLYPGTRRATTARLGRAPGRLSGTRTTGAYRTRCSCRDPR